MNKNLSVWQYIADNLRENRWVALLIVAESSGSSPGRAGFKMAVTKDELFGSIGGGVMEVSLVEKSRLEQKGPDISTAVIEQVHQKNSPDSSGMICSGRQTVISVSLQYSDLAVVEKIIEPLKSGFEKRIRITTNGIALVDSQNQQPLFLFERRAQDQFLFEEQVGFQNRLFVVGGGHCALALTKLMSGMDFHISLFDDRPKLNTLSKNNSVHKKQIIESYDKIGDYIASGMNHYVVVMTLGYKFDAVVIRSLLNRDFKYFGVLGSKAKMAVLLKELENEGFDKKRLARIRTPIGIAIDSHTPEEIAVSIAAEVIAVKNAKG